MRYDAEHKARTRRTLLKAASTALRAEGPERLGVAAIMARAGLTHGGFYAHFESKDALVVEAIETAFDDARDAFARSLADRSPQDALRAYIRFYLSRSHRDDVGGGCPVAALSADLPRLGPGARAAFGAGVERLRARLSGLIAACGLPDPDLTAASVLSEMQGALALSRAVADPAQSEATLRASRRALFRRLNLEEAA
jgi:TetR/AcrR family transcriptional repressor of nem operon